MLRWIIEKLVDGLVIDVFLFRAHSLLDFLLESSGDLLGRPAQLQFLQHKGPKGWAVGQEIFLVGVTLPCLCSLVGLDGAIDPISLVSFQSSSEMLDGLLPSRLAISRIVIPLANHQAIWSRSSAVIVWCLFIRTVYWASPTVRILN